MYTRGCGAETGFIFVSDVARILHFLLLGLIFLPVPLGEMSSFNISLVVEVSIIGLDVFI